jgi:hypothetical protein
MGCMSRYEKTIQKKSIPQDAQKGIQLSRKQIKIGGVPSGVHWEPERCEDDGMMNGEMRVSARLG